MKQKLTKKKQLQMRMNFLIHEMIHIKNNLKSSKVNKKGAFENINDSLNTIERIVCAKYNK